MGGKKRKLRGRAKRQITEQERRRVRAAAAADCTLEEMSNRFHLSKENIKAIINGEDIEETRTLAC